jgi:hypothetical protein
MLAVGMTGRLAAQTAASGAVAGTVHDASGAVVAGTEVTATNEGTGESRKVTAGEGGKFIIPLLPPGRYRVESHKAGFRSEVVSGIEVNVTETARFDVVLQVGSLDQSVTVEAAPAMVQTDSTALGRVTGEREVTGLPLVSRNYTQILGLSAGVVTGVNNAAALGNGGSGVGYGGAPSVHGNRPYDNSFKMNGVSVDDPGGQTGVPVPNPDALQEFKVQTGQHDASYGRNAGANVNVVTRSGSNQLHGSLFEFFRNEKFNANDFFSNRQGRPRGLLRQNQFGLAVGGPIIRNKLFFFGSYQGTRQTNGIVGTCRANAQTPPLTDDRSAAAIGRMYAGRRGLLQTQLGNVGPAILADGSNIHPVALKLLQAKRGDGSFVIPTPQTINPNAALDVQGFSAFSEACSFNENQGVASIDYLPTSKQKLTYRMFISPMRQTTTFPGGQVPGFQTEGDTTFTNLSASHRYIARADLLNEFQVAFNRILGDPRPQSPFKYSDLGILAASDNLPSIGFGALTVGGGFPVSAALNTYHLEDSVWYVKGRNTLRIGGSASRIEGNVFQFKYISQLAFLSFPDFLLGLNGQQNGTGISNVYGSVDLIGQPERMWRAHDGSLFVQNDWKVSPRLTLNLGMRYERLGHYADKLGRNGQLFLSRMNPNPAAAGSIAGYMVPSNFRGTVPDGVGRLDNEWGLNGNGQNNFAPRIGFAWQALPTAGRLTIRGGFGTYYSRPTIQQWFQVLGGPPFTLLRISTAAANAAATLATPFDLPLPPGDEFPKFFPYSPTTTRTSKIVDPDFRSQIVQQGSFNIQSQLQRNLLLEVGYVGNRGTHMVRSRSVNQSLAASDAAPIRGFTTNTFANIARRVPFAGWTPDGLVEIESSGSLWYHGLNATLTRRFSKGLQFLGAYTFSRSVDSEGFNSQQSSAGTAIPLGDQNNAAGRRGPSSYTRRHRFVLSAIYEVPSFVSGGPLKALASGWSISGVTVIQSGVPLTFTGTNANNAFGITGDRAQLAPGCTHADLVNAGNLRQNLSNYFSRSCFTTYQVTGSDGRATAFGNSGVGIVEGPGQANVDVAIRKRTAVRAISETAAIEFRAEAFNLLNRAHFGNPNLNSSAAGFGSITNTVGNPRLMQFALKFLF